MEYVTAFKQIIYKEKVIKQKRKKRQEREGKENFKYTKKIYKTDNMYKKSCKIIPTRDPPTSFFCGAFNHIKWSSSADPSPAVMERDLLTCKFSSCYDL